MSKINNHQELEVYQLAFTNAMEIFNLSNNFPRTELYSLTDQIRRSSRSVCANIAEAFRKRRYRKAFIANYLMLKAKLGNSSLARFALIAIILMKILKIIYIYNMTLLSEN